MWRAEEEADAPAVGVADVTLCELPNAWLPVGVLDDDGETAATGGDRVGGERASPERRASPAMEGFNDHPRGVARAGERALAPDAETVRPPSLADALYTTRGQSAARSRDGRSRRVVPDRRRDPSRGVRPAAAPPRHLALFVAPFTLFPAARIKTARTS